MEYWFLSNEKKAWIGPCNRELLDRAHSEGQITGGTLIHWDSLPYPGVEFMYLDCEYFVQAGDLLEHRPLKALRDLNELVEVATSGQLPLNAVAYQQQERAKPLPLQIFRDPAIDFSPTPWSLVKSRVGKPVTVLTGPNNCGKSYLLKSLQMLHGKCAQLILPGRFNDGATGTQTGRKTKVELEQTFANFVQQHTGQNKNFDTLNNQMERNFQALPDPLQDRLLNIVSGLIGIDLKYVRIGESERSTAWEVTADGEPLSVTSAGTRLLLSLLATCMLPEYSVVLIDEPEIGLSPRLQNVLATMLYDHHDRNDLFPNTQQFIISTHSHVFIDRSEISNNFVLHRNGKSVSIKSMESMSALHNLQLNMLGNDLRTLFLPEAIVLVEGPSDQEFLAQVFSQLYPARQISVINCHGDGKIAEKIHTLSAAFGGLNRSPYADRILCVMDQKNSANRTRICRQGLTDDQIIIWEQNGIEYVYPDTALSSVFGSTDRSAIKIDDNDVALNGIRKSKTALASEVIKHVRPDTTYPCEFNEKLLTPLRRILGIG